MAADNIIEIAQLHKALTVAQGKREDAATALGWTLERVKELISESTDLQTMWGKGTAALVTVEEAYDRERPDMTEPIDLGISPRQLAVSSAFFNQEAKLQKFDWEGLGESDKKTLALMAQFEGNGVGRGVLKMMDAMQGGMAYCFMQVSRQFADVAEELKGETAKDPTEVDPRKRRDEGRVMLLHARFMDLGREMQKFNKEATNAAHTRLLIADRAKRIQKAQDKMRKPSWQRATPVSPNS